MHALRNPNQAYRRVDFEARVVGGSPRDLVLVCYDQLGQSIARALACHDRRDNLGKSEALTRALTAIAALQMGIDPAAPMAGALGDFYAGARRVLLDAVLNFDPGALASLNQDVRDVARALADAGAAA